VDCVLPVEPEFVWVETKELVLNEEPEFVVVPDEVLLVELTVFPRSDLVTLEI
jgi:hypothetical protein